MDALNKFPEKDISSEQIFLQDLYGKDISSWSICDSLADILAELLWKREIIVDTLKIHLRD